MLLVGALGPLGIVATGLVLTLWGSHGHLPAVIAGQFDHGPALEDRDVSIRPPSDVPPLSVALSIDTSTVLRSVDERYLSFAIDTSVVVGGKWWNPKAEGREPRSGGVHAPVFDFDRPRLDALTRALAPAYLRIGGSEADKLFYGVEPGAEGDEPPPGYESVLTRDQWDGVCRFAKRNELDLVMTLNAGPGPRDRAGRWQSENAEALLEYTRAQGCRVAHWEFGNELNLFWFVQGLSKQVDPSQYVEDLRRLRSLVAEYHPDALVSGQSAAFWPVLGEPLGFFFGFQTQFARRGGAYTDTFGWHYYPQQGRRGPFASRRATPGRLLHPDNLDEVVHWARHNMALRDSYSPGRPLWLGETGHAQFGGEPGISDRYLASLWWLDQLGLLAVHGHDVVVRQTLCGSNYQLVTATDLEPLPDYWASLLWKKLMGTEVLAARAEGSDKVRVYAHRTPDGKSVASLIINLNPRRRVQVEGTEFGPSARVYRITSEDLFGTKVRLNGRPLKLLDARTLPELSGAPVPPKLIINPLSYAFVVTRVR